MGSYRNNYLRLFCRLFLERLSSDTYLLDFCSLAIKQEIKR